MQCIAAVVADFSLLLNAPDMDWAEHIQTLIQRALGSRGSLSLGALSERVRDSASAPGDVVTGVAVCDQPEDEMLDLIR